MTTPRLANMQPLVRDALLSFMTARKIGSQSEFAKAVKLSTGYICDVLALRRNLSPEIIDRMTKAYGLTRKQIADFNHRAAQVAGWKLPPLPDDQQIALVEPSEKLMRPRREYAAAAKAAGRPTRVKRVGKAPPSTNKAGKERKDKAAKVAKGKGKKPAKEKHAAETTTITARASKSRPVQPAAGFVPPSMEDLARDAERDL
jgi:hypothetical protein